MRRMAAAIGCALLSCAASAQFSESMGGTFRAIRYFGLFPAPPSTNPLDAKGFKPNLPEKNPVTGPEPDSSGDLIVRPASGASHHTNANGVDHWEGGFVAEYKGYTMEGDVVDGNRSSQVYIISGNAKLTGPDAVVLAR